MLASMHGREDDGAYSIRYVDSMMTRIMARSSHSLGVEAFWATGGWPNSLRTRSHEQVHTPLKRIGGHIKLQYTVIISVVL